MNLGETFNKAADKHCDEDGCYIGTCPVNCLASLVSKHLKDNDFFMLFGDYMIAKRLAKK